MAVGTLDELYAVLMAALREGPDKVWQPGEWDEFMLRVIREERKKKEETEK